MESNQIPKNVDIYQGFINECIPLVSKDHSGAFIDACVQCLDVIPLESFSKMDPSTIINLAIQHGNAKVRKVFRKVLIGSEFLTKIFLNNLSVYLNTGGHSIEVLKCLKFDQKTVLKSILEYVKFAVSSTDLTEILHFIGNSGLECDMCHLPILVDLVRTHNQFALKMLNSARPTTELDDEMHKLVVEVLKIGSDECDMAIFTFLSKVPGLKKSGYIYRIATDVAMLSTRGTFETRNAHVTKGFPLICPNICELMYQASCHKFSGAWLPINPKLLGDGALEWQPPLKEYFERDKLVVYMSGCIHVCPVEVLNVLYECDDISPFEHMIKYLISSNNKDVLHDLVVNCDLVNWKVFLPLILATYTKPFLQKHIEDLLVQILENIKNQDDFIEILWPLIKNQSELCLVMVKICQLEKHLFKGMECYKNWIPFLNNEMLFKQKRILSNLPLTYLTRYIDEQFTFERYLGLRELPQMNKLEQFMIDTIHDYSQTKYAGSYSLYWDFALYTNSTLAQKPAWDCEATSQNLANINAILKKGELVVPSDETAYKFIEKCFVDLNTFLKSKDIILFLYQQTNLKVNLRHIKRFLVNELNKDSYLLIQKFLLDAKEEIKNENLWEVVTIISICSVLSPGNKVIYSLEKYVQSRLEISTD